MSVSAVTTLGPIPVNRSAICSSSSLNVSTSLSTSIFCCSCSGRRCHHPRGPGTHSDMVDD